MQLFVYRVLFLFIKALVSCNLLPAEISANLICFMQSSTLLSSIKSSSKGGSGR